MQSPLRVHPGFLKREPLKATVRTANAAPDPIGPPCGPSPQKLHLLQAFIFALLVALPPRCTSARTPRHRRPRQRSDGTSATGLILKVWLLLFPYCPKRIDEPHEDDPALGAALIELREERRGRKALIVLAVEDIRHGGRPR